MKTNKTNTDKTKIKQKIESLEKQSQLIRNELNDEIEISINRVVDIGKVVLGIAGGLVFSAIVLGGLSGRKSKKKEIGKSRPSKRVYQRLKNQLANELSYQATLFITGVLKDKLSSYLKENDKSGEDDSEDLG